MLRLSGFIMFPTRSDHAMLMFTKLAISREIDIGLVGITGNTSPKDVEVQLLTQQTHETECLMQNMFVVHNTGWDIFLNILGSTQIGPVGIIVIRLHPGKSELLHAAPRPNCFV